MSDLLAMLVACVLCARAQRFGQTVRDRDVLAAGVPDTQWRRLRERLRQQRILARTVGGAYVLARHPGQLSVTQIAALAPADVLGEAPPRVPGPLREMPGFADLESVLLAGREVAGKRMDISLEELIGGHPPAQAAGA